MQAVKLHNIFLQALNPKIEITSTSFSKLKNDNSFSKYNIEASLDEVESRDSEVVLKYKLVFLSNPTNSKIQVEGLTTLYGDQSAISAQLGPDEQNIPIVLGLIYQEIFPLLFITSKSMQIPCPAYKLAQMTAQPSSTKTASDQIQKSAEVKTIELSDNENTIEEQIETESTLKEQVIEQQM